MRTITELAVEQLVAYNAADLDAFCACYHPEVQVLQGSQVVAVGIDAFRAIYADKFARGGFGGVVPRRVERGGEVCIEEEHYWVDGPQGRTEGVVLVRWTLREGLIGEVAFSPLTALIETVHDALLEGARVTVPGLGMFTPCTRASGCRTVMFRARPGSGSPDVEALKDFLTEEDRLDLAGLGTLKAEDNRGGRRLRFHASEAFMALLTEAVWPE